MDLSIKGDCDDDTECDVRSYVFSIGKYGIIVPPRILTHFICCFLFALFTLINQGDLRCFQRDGIEPVPGCSGTGDSAWDYCYDRSRFPYQIILKENNLGRDSYGLCEGNCSSVTVF